MLKIKIFLIYIIYSIIIQQIIFWFSIFFIGESFVHPKTQLIPFVSSKDITNFKIQNNLFPYLKSGKTELQIDQPDYDKYLIYYNYPLKEIHRLIKNRPESDLLKLTNFLYEGNRDYLDSSDSEIIYSLHYLINEEQYIKEIKGSSEILKRVKNIKGGNILIAPYGLKTIQNKPILLYKEIILKKLNKI